MNLLKSALIASLILTATTPFIPPSYARDNRQEIRSNLNNEGWDIITVYRLDHWEYAGFAAKLASGYLPAGMAQKIASTYNRLYSALGDAQTAKAIIDSLTSSGKSTALANGYETRVKLLTYNHWHSENPCSLWGGECWKKIPEPNTHELVLITRRINNKRTISAGNFKFNHNATIYYSNGQGHYCAFDNWNNFVRLSNGNTTWRDLPGTLKDYSMTYDGICTGG